MGRTFAQIAAVTSMNIRSLPLRKWTSLATIVAVALVTGVLLAFLAMAYGFQSTVQGTGAPDVAVMLRKGSGNELNSTVTREQALLMEEAPGIARGADGKPLISSELYVVVDGYKKTTHTKANLPLRGLGARAEQVRRGVTVTQGRMFRPGTNELVVGRAVSKQFEGFELGRKIKLGTQNLERRRRVRGGTARCSSSELWADVAVLAGSLSTRQHGADGARAAQRPFEFDRRCRLFGGRSAAEARRAGGERLLRRAEQGLERRDLVPRLAACDRDVVRRDRRRAEHDVRVGRCAHARDRDAAGHRVRRDAGLRRRRWWNR